MAKNGESASAATFNTPEVQRARQRVYQRMGMFALLGAIDVGLSWRAEAVTHNPLISIATFAAGLAGVVIGERVLNPTSEIIDDYQKAVAEAALQHPPSTPEESTS